MEKKKRKATSIEDPVIEEIEEDADSESIQV
jgi:hypothetical protein